ncbi:MAG TPA: hypothetical protein QGH10_04060 [Armatimonadota bacterium]|nr:hypothetical protein [Armatimonadota bacterium]
MPELLVAMMVLLVGIWVVAAKFPKLSALMRETAMADTQERKAEQKVEQAKSEPVSLPDMVAMYDPALVSALNPYGIPDGIPSWVDPATNLDWDSRLRPLNAVENMVNVVGETFRVPMAWPGAPGPAAPYFLKQGPAEQVYAVYQPIPLTRDDELPPASRQRPHPGTFYMQDDGVIRSLLPQRDPLGETFYPVVPSNQSWMEVSYDWVDGDGYRHRVTDELVLCQRLGLAPYQWNTAPVAAVADAGGSVLPHSVSATWRYYYRVLPLGTAPGAGPPVAYVDWQFGHVLWFEAIEQGRTVAVDYRLQRVVNPSDPTDPDTGRRVPLMSEVHRVPDEPSRIDTSDPTNPTEYQVQLTLGHLEDQIPLFSVDLSGTGLASPLDACYVMAFDLETGARYSDAETTLRVEQMVDGEIVPGWARGLVSFPPGSAAAGRELVFYYRTLDRHTVQLHRAPSSLVEDIWSGPAGTAPGASVPGYGIGRWYCPTDDGANPYPAGAMLVLPNSALQQTFRVEYIGRAGRTVEVHALGDQPPAILLVDDPVPAGGGNPASAEILSISGISLKGFASWRETGKLRTADVETLLTQSLDSTLSTRVVPHALEP